MKTIRSIILFTLLILAACSAAPSAGNTVTGIPIKVDNGSFLRITPVELKSLLEKKDFIFINVHIPFDGSIHGTDLSIPYNELGKNLSRLPANKNTRIILYCRSGRMSTIAAEELVKYGYTNVWELDGGMVAWQQAGFEIQR